MVNIKKYILIQILIFTFALDVIAKENFFLEGVKLFNEKKFLDSKFKFEKEVKDEDILMDFGCGGGYLLDQFNNKKKIGFEINKSAWEEIKKKGIEVYDKYEDIDDNSIDTIISNHAMEHVPLPLNTLKNL